MRRLRTTDGPAELAFMDLPLLKGNEAEAAPTLAAYASPWRDVAVYRSPTATGFALNTRLTQPATMGELTAPLYSGPTSRWDRGNSVYVRLYGDDDQLSAKEDLLVFDGGNVLCVENADGEWEVLQFADAELTGSKTYRLSRLLRGQAGTEGALRDPVASGARIVLLDSACEQATLVPDERELPFNWKWGPAAADLSAASFQSATRAFEGVGLRPLSPVHIRARRDAVTGDITLSWIRRTRRNGDSWTQIEVPLAEEREAYAVDILGGDSVKRTLSAAESSVLYSAADQLADWGDVLPATLTVAVVQVSITFGRGQSRTATLSL
ncbi:hypothetical protein SAMN05216548_110159 [Faunimonas pinastri]|uniref:Rcc01698-like C-terminal domain-containing protein n=1 Tax=Faunimonas pinastri TaxID=1855383 RepID=A0A1H9L1H4_9HYPH|nr:hypothetical protein [Faunimonas pinastri]SER05312.1 hypothetical protein SAMN05216548_110159 [Faunimonas pinastri]